MNRYYFSAELDYQRKTTLHPNYNETSLHSHSQYEILLFEAGNAELILKDRRVPLSHETMLLIPPDMPHRIALLSDLPYQRSVINFKELPAGVGADLFDEVRVIPLGRHRLILSVWERMREYSELFSSEKRDVLLHGLVTELLLVTEKLQPVSVTSDQQYSHFVHKVLEYIEGHITEIMDVEEICKQMHVSRAYLYREFRAALHISPKRYINVKRLNIARELLLLGEDATGVALRCGYRDYSSFYRAYRSYFGCSPNQTHYKAKNTEEF